MFSRFRARFGTPGVVIAVIAMVFAMAGGAYAASGALTGKQKKEVEKIAKKYAGKPGKPGATGPAGPAGANGKDGSNGTNGSNGAEGKQGPKGDKGDRGEKGEEGEEGEPGEPGESVTATPIAAGPSETKCNHLGGAEFKVGSGTPTFACNGAAGSGGGSATQTGFFAFKSTEGMGTMLDGQKNDVTMSFTTPVVPKFTEQILVQPQSPSGAYGSVAGKCPGVTAEVPKAEPGYLCLYSKGGDAAVFGEFVPGLTLTSNVTPTSPTGQVQELECVSPTVGICIAEGTWAVTVAS